MKFGHSQSLTITQLLHPTHLPMKKSTMKLYFTTLKNGKHSMSASRNTCFKLSNAQIRLDTNHRGKTIQCFFKVIFTSSRANLNIKFDPKKGSIRSLFQSFYLASILKLDTCCNEYRPSPQERNVKNERVIDRRTSKNSSLSTIQPSSYEVAQACMSN